MGSPLVVRYQRAGIQSVLKYFICIIDPKALKIVSWNSKAFRHKTMKYVVNHHIISWWKLLKFYFAYRKEEDRKFKKRHFGIVALQVPLCIMYGCLICGVKGNHRVSPFILDGLRGLLVCSLLFAMKTASTCISFTEDQNEQGLIKVWAKKNRLRALSLIPASLLSPCSFIYWTVGKSA